MTGENGFNLIKHSPSFRHISSSLEIKNIFSLTLPQVLPTGKTIDETKADSKKITDKYLGHMNK